MNSPEPMREKPQWNIRAGMIYWGEKCWHRNPQGIFEVHGIEYPRIHPLEHLVSIFKANRWVPDPSELECDA